MTERDGFVERDGVLLHYVDWGGDGPPLVLVHATSFFGRIWRPVIEALGGRFRVITPDQRAHGDSGRPDDGYTFETFAEDLQAIIEALGLGRVFAAGHSSGGTTVALHTALHPGVVTRMALIEPILVAPPFVRRGPNPMADQARKRRPVWDSPQSMFEAYRSRPPFDTWREDVLRLYAEEGTRAVEGGYELKCLPEYEARFYEAVTALDPWPYLERIECPALVAWAEHGRPAPMFDRDAVARAVRGSKTIVIPGATHFVPMERPEEVAELLAGWFSD